ncbi:amino acid ABC transporter substrate-binding protein, PAAT family [Massilia sp. CF038]|nr:amino acid ABC transporter substrate-binding protein, PAAT family [Massilia sp. CF038]
MLKRFLVALALLHIAYAAMAAEGDLRMIAPRNQTMPLAQFENDKLTGGMLKDLGDAIARRIGRRAVFVSVAGDQVAAALSSGKADGICYVRPFWIDGDFLWSQPVIPDAELVASLPDAPVVRSLLDLRDRPVGTVTGYRYPRVEQVLGLRFQRLESATMEDNLRKMMAGGARHTLLGRATMVYQRKINPALKLRPDLVIASFTAQCAFSRQSEAPFAEIDKAIKAMLADGTVKGILSRYR